MQKKINVTLLLTILLIVLIIFSVIRFIIQFNDFRKELIAINIEQIDFSKVREGIYNAKLDMQFISAKVLVTVTGNKVVKIDLLSHKHGPSKKYDAGKIIDSIIMKQSLDVDAVSGASGSSKVIKKAVEAALKKGL